MSNVAFVNIPDWLKNNPDKSQDYVGVWNSISLAPKLKGVVALVLNPDESDSPSEWLKEVSEIADILNMAPREAGLYYDLDQAERLQITEQYFRDENNLHKLLASVLLWDGTVRYSGVMTIVMNKLEDYTKGLWMYEELDPKQRKRYSRLSYYALWDNFPLLDSVDQTRYISGEALLVWIAMGLDLFDMCRRAINSIVYLDYRIKLSQHLAFCIYTNEVPFGSGDNMSALAYWIDSWRNFSGQKFDGVSLINFFQSDEYFTNVEDSDKDAIKKCLMLYGQLVSRTFVYPTQAEIDEWKKTKAATPVLNVIKDRILTDLKNVEENEKSAYILKVLQDFSVRYNQPEIQDWYYFDESTGQFKWQE